MDNSEKFIRFARFIHFPLTIITALLVTYAQYVVFMVVPDEKIMGAVQRVFYFHVGSAFACYVQFGIAFATSLWFLTSSNRLADIINAAAAEVGFVFCSITLASGMIWGHSAWNTWFRWEPRLVTFLILWLLFLGFVIHRKYGEGLRLASQSAVLSILGGLTVPFVWLSVKLLPQTAQLHPQVVENQGLKDPLFLYGFGVCSVTIIVLSLLLLNVRIRIESLNQRAV